MKPIRKLTTTPTIDPAMNPAALLRGAAMYLRTYGWTQGEIFANSDTGTPFPAACAIGAINVAAHGSPLLSASEHSDDESTAAAMRAMRVFAAWIDLEYTPSSAYCASAIDVIGDWNDDYSRKLDEVIEVLTDAADNWDATHSGGAR